MLLSGESSQHQAPIPKFQLEWVVWAEAASRVVACTVAGWGAVQVVLEVAHRVARAVVAMVGVLEGAREGSQVAVSMAAQEEARWAASWVAC